MKTKNWGSLLLKVVTLVERPWGPLRWAGRGLVPQGDCVRRAPSAGTRWLLGCQPCGVRGGVRGGGPLRIEGSGAKA